jgi:hypothetical protein
VSEKPSFVRCPYCRRKLDKTPKRKTNCLYCDKPIYVRGGKLVREDALGAASAKPARKPTSKKPPSGSAKKPAKSKPKPKLPGQLGADLKKKREKYSQKDLLAGLQLLLQVAGAVIVSGGLGSLLGGLFGGGPDATRSQAGLASALQSVDADELLAAAANAYASLDDEQKFHMRAVVTWVQNGFPLPEEVGV